jgi:LuxR family transcriptional regulator, quorum-sensing system regulator SolR
MKTSDPNYIVSQTVDSVRQICSPLKHIGITGFIYARHYPNDSFFELKTDYRWGEFFYNKLFDKQYRKTDISEITNFTDKFMLWKLNQHNAVWQDAKIHFGQDNGILIYKHHLDYTEIYFYFSDDEHHKQNDFYVNNLEMLDRFSLYFSENAKALIKLAESHKLQVPSFYLEDSENNIATKQRTGFQQFLEETALTTIPIDNKKHLTPRELECLYWQSQGKTMEEIGIILEITTRTVKAHIRNIKDKLSCESQFQLGLTYERAINRFLSHEKERVS